MASHMANMDSVGRDCKGFFQGQLLKVDEAGYVAGPIGKPMTTHRKHMLLILLLFNLECDCRSYYGRLFLCKYSAINYLQCNK